MPFVPSFTVSNNAVNPTTFTIVDTSTGTDVLIVDRQILIYDATNTLILGSPIDFPVASGTTINLNILSQDVAVNIIINWNYAGGVVTYTANQIFGFTGFLEWFFYGLIQQIAAKATIANDTNFIANLSKLRVLIDAVNNAITFGQSIFNAQNMISMAQYMQTNTTLFF